MPYNYCDKCKNDYEFLINNINEAVFKIDNKGILKYLNKSWTDITGFSSSESIGKSFIEFIHPRDREEKLKQFIEAVKRKEKNHKVNYRHLTQDNEYLWVEILSKIILDKDDKLEYVIGTITDRAGESNKTLEIELKEIVDISKSIVYKLKRNSDGSYVFTFFGSSIVKNLNISSEMLSNMRLEELINKEEYQRFKLKCERVYDGDSITFDAEYNGKHYHNTLTPIKENDEVVGILCCADDITDLKKAKNQILYMSYYDKLTGLPNRDYLSEYFDKNYSSLVAYEDRLALLFLNIDRFKNINDSLGYSVGDELLKHIADRFKNYLYDRNAMIIRMSGDKFIVITEYEERKEIDNLVKGLFNILKEPFKVYMHELFITTSIGISIYSSYCDSLDNLMKYAETAMHRTKDEGKNGYQYFREFMNLENIRELTIETQLRKALDRDEFYLLYQPKVNTVDGVISGVEALIRWESPELGLVSPAEFIGIAEETGLIVPIGAWVLEESCKQAKYWNDDGFNVVVSVNISAVQLQRYNFVDTVKNIIKKTGIKPEHLDLEITENGIMKNVEKSEHIMRELSSMGIIISIDDFGTGFSSLSYIKRFQANTLKIDRSFVKDIPNDENDMSITLAVINMARSLNMSTVAEGVENINQLEFLRENKCDVIQGYYFSKPVLPDKMEKLLEYNKTYLYRNL